MSYRRFTREIPNELNEYNVFGENNLRHFVHTISQSPWSYSKKGFVTRQRKHIVIATWPNLINIPSNKPVKSRTVWVPSAIKFSIEKYSKNRYCFGLWILSILGWTSSAAKTVRKISLLEIRVRNLKKSIWDLPSESYRFLGSDTVFSPKINLYPITLQYVSSEVWVYRNRIFFLARLRRARSFLDHFGVFFLQNVARREAHDHFSERSF